MDFRHLTKISHRTISFLTLASSVLLALGFMFSFDMINGYFTGGILPILFEIAFILGILLSLASALALNKHEIVKSKNHQSERKGIYISLAAILAICSLVFNFFVGTKFFTISIIGTCFFALFIFSCAKNGYEYSGAKLFCLLLATLFPIATTISNNSVMHRHSNSLENTLTAVFAIAFLIYILYEGNRLFTGAHSRWHLTSMLLLSHTGFSLSVAYIIAYFTYDVNERVRFYQMILVLLISIFVEIELVQFVKNAEAHTEAEWNEIEAPEMPEEEIEQTEEENINEEKTDE